MFCFHSVTQCLVIHQLWEIIKTNDYKSGHLGAVAKIPLTTILRLMTVFVSVCSKAQENPQFIFLADNKRYNYKTYL